MTAPSNRRRLGRGLEALLGPSREEAEQQGNFREVAVDGVVPNPYQPRQSFDEEALTELAQSIQAAGLLQPIVVRPHGADGFELVVGERRWRAAVRLGWKTIPAVVRDVDDTTLLTLALVENLQRHNLSPIEEARGYERLSREFGMSQQDMARTVGRDRSTIANALRLLKLPQPVQDLVDRGALSVGHARALLALNDAGRIAELAGSAVKEGWSVRDVEDHARQGKPKAQRRPRRPLKKPVLSAEAKRVQTALERHLQTDVRVVTRGERGRLEITYYSNDDLARVLELILGEPFS